MTLALQHPSNNPLPWGLEWTEIRNNTVVLIRKVPYFTAQKYIIPVLCRFCNSTWHKYSYLGLLF